MKVIFSLFILTAFLIGCNKTVLKQSSEQELKTESKLQEYIENIEKNALPIVINELKGVDKRFNTVIDYGKWLEDNKGKNTDSLTIHSNEYWKAFITMSMNNPNVYFTRLFYLIMDGEITRTDYVKIFTSWHCDFKRESNKKVLQIISGWQKRIKDDSNAWVKKGISEFDKGNKKGSMEYYQMALNLWPKNPWANYEIGLTMMMDTVKHMFEDSRPCDKYFEKTRKIDPFYGFAYQGKKEIAQGMLVIMKDIEPALKRMTSGQVKAEDMKMFADGCVTLKEYELAAYAYHFQLHMTMDKSNGFDEAVVKNFKECVNNLGANEAAEMIEEQFKEYNRLLKEDKQKKG